MVVAVYGEGEELVVVEDKVVEDVKEEEKNLKDMNFDRN